MGSFTGGIRRDKPAIDELYRPFLELDCRFCQKFATSEISSPLLIADVGSRGGLDPRWEVFGKHYIEIGFEPEAEERERILAVIASKGESDRKIIHPSILWSDEGSYEFKIPPSCKETASLLDINHDFYKRLPNPNEFTEVNRISVKTTTLDKCKWPNNDLDFLKVDVEGGDLFVLRGGKEILSSKTLGVIAEVTFVGQFIGQGYFADIDLLLRSYGFVFFDLKPRRWRKKKLSSEFDNFRMGQMVAGDVLYLKDPVANWDSFSESKDERNKLLKLAALAEFFALPDYGIEIIELAKSKGFCTLAEAENFIELLNSNKIEHYNDFTRHGPTNEKKNTD